ncbi:MAG: hypothetical protein Q7S34_00795, partial [bacterium]|nr:hypothetical protein [bacterium]
IGLNIEISQQKETIDLSPLQNIKNEVGSIYNTFKDVGDNLQKIKDLPSDTTTTTAEEKATTTP